MHFSSLDCMLHAPPISQTEFDHCSNRPWQVQTMMSSVFYFLFSVTVCCCFFHFRSKYYPQHCVLKTHSVWRERSSGIHYHVVS
jgi:hypothetical protein